MPARAMIIVMSVLLVSLAAVPVTASLVQQGGKLVGTGSVGVPQQGWSVSLSADGNTAVVGGFSDNALAGAAWVFTRSASVWSQQGTKLVGTGAAGRFGAHQGYSVAVSADGSTAVVGGPWDNSLRGSVWVYTRSAGVWSQQGSKLAGAGAAGDAKQGYSVAASADGNTIVVGGVADNSGSGAAWIFKRNAGVWSQEGGKLVGNDVVGAAEQGFSVAISGDGNTALVGGRMDDGVVGAAWVYTRTAGVWSQQGTKLAGNDAVGNAQQGISVALSSDGNTAIVGGVGDDNQQGAAWVYTRSSGAWSQQGTKLVGTGAVGSANQGSSVALSADGNVAVVGGRYDNGGVGAAWVYTRTAGVWSQQGVKLMGSGAVGNALQGISVSLSADGNTVVLGASGDNGSLGATWVFVNPLLPAANTLGMILVGMLMLATSILVLARAHKGKLA